jgi:hypothetical protein
MRKLLFLLLAVASLPVLAQVKNEQFKNLKPRNIGPAGMSGRVTAIDALYTNPDVIHWWVAPAPVCGRPITAAPPGSPCLMSNPSSTSVRWQVQQSNPSM